MWHFEVYKDQNDWRWRLVLRNALIVESSECFAGSADAQRAAEVARADLDEAPIDVLPLPVVDEFTQPEHTAALHAELRADTIHWNALPLVGFQYGEESDQASVVVELRHCTCGSTLGRRVR